MPFDADRRLTQALRQQAARFPQVRRLRDRLRGPVEPAATTQPSPDEEATRPWLTWRPPGHFYSPIPDGREIARQAAWLWPAQRPATLPGIDLRPEAQLARFSRLASLAKDLPVHPQPTEDWRYHSDNVSFGVGDALMLHGMLRDIKPRRLIEIGSGHSSAMTLDTVERFLDHKTEVTFVEPYPELLESLLTPQDREHVTILPSPVQDIDPAVFGTLESGDVLFVDSTHVLKPGSDVQWLYEQVFPALNPGVYLHIHDIFYPFQYPREWIMEGRAWTEAYILRAFLTCNADFQVELFSDWLAVFHCDLIAAELPAMLANTGGSIWLRRITS